jgi:Ni/Fe-hydrogenase 1 B-type cytochrome subunit
MTTDATHKPGEDQAEAPPALVTIKVWELPVRVVHWTIFVSVIVLSITGFYIGTPFLTTGSDPKFLMGWMRAIHDLAAFVFIAAVLARIIWAFTGNRWSRWDQFVPTSKDRRANARQALRYYLFMSDDPPHETGHNALAGATYFVLFVMFLVQILTGLALLSLETEGFLATTTGWVFAIMPIPWVRFLHHLIMWLTWGFVVHHVYSAWLVDSDAKAGLLSSIFTGWKRLPPEEL